MSQNHFTLQRLKGSLHPCYAATEIGCLPNMPAGATCLQHENGFEARLAWTPGCSTMLGIQTVAGAIKRLRYPRDLVVLNLVKSLVNTGHVSL